VAETDWALRLFRRSVLKQRKLAEIEAMLGPTPGLRCLDLGSDNGVVSLLLRRRGGSWASADMTEESVASIRELVGSDVHLLAGPRLPFGAAEFDRVVVVDMLEHVEDDRGFVLELFRVLKPGGRLVVNTPHLRDTPLRRLRHRLGQTDERHGHVRAGYTAAALQALLEPNFAFEAHRTYSHSFTELVDTAIQLALSGTGKKGSAKGVVVTGADLKRHGALFRAYSVVYPALWAVSRLDLLLPRSSGYMLIAAATRRA
jgi:ubiquinone/menaquinone biosynthesis C-methylase UbiE